MNFSIVFDNSGDAITFKTVSNQAADLLCYYVENLDAQNMNCFVSSDNVGHKIQQNIKRLHSTLEQCNLFVYELLDQYLHTYNDVEYLDQILLNQIHADWVKSQTKMYDIKAARKKYASQQSELIHDMFPDDIPVASLGNIINKLGHKTVYDQINKDLHNIETIFDAVKFQVQATSWFQIDNPFDKGLVDNNISNFTLAFNHLGRTLYNKYVYGDTNLMAHDENTYNELLGFVELKFVPPQTIPLSKEYVAWAVKHNKIPTGDNLNIGNIPDLVDRLTDYRKILFQNTLQNHTFSIQLTKG